MVISFVLANMGTPLMHLGCGHLVFLNLFLGLIEGSLLARWAKVKPVPAIAFMIVGNYASAWIGYGLVSLFAPFQAYDIFADPPLYHIGKILALAVVATFAFTVVVEMPFCLFAVRKGTASRSRRLWWGVLVQMLTYAGLSLLYVPASPMTVLTQCTRVQDATRFVPEIRAWVYYVGADGWLTRCRPSGSDVKRLLDLNTDLTFATYGEGLWARRYGDANVDLILRFKGADQEALRDVRGRIGVPLAEMQPGEPTGPSDQWPLDLRPEHERIDYYFGGHFAESGLEHEVWTSATDRKYPTTSSRVNLATPFFQWRASFPTMLPGGFVIFEFGKQIMVMDAHRRIAAIARGRSPIVIMEQRQP